MQEVEGSTTTGGTCPNAFSDPIDQNINTKCGLSWKKVYVLSNRQTCSCVRKTQARRKAPVVRGHDSVPLNHFGNVVRKTGIYLPILITLKGKFTLQLSAVLQTIIYKKIYLLV